MQRHLRKTVLAAAALCFAGASGQAVAGPSGLSVTTKFPGPDGGWDYASFDPARRRVYVAHGASVLMIDADTGKVTPSFAEGSHLHAVTPVPGTDLIVTTNSGDNTARVISATDGRLIASVPAAKDTDSAVFDPSTGYVLAVGGDSGEITLVDAKAGKAAGSIMVGGGLEFGDVDGKGRLFINSEEKHEVAVIDIAARKVVARYAMPTCMRPTGLALATGDRIISACANGVAEILDAATGKEIAALKIGERPDAVICDPARSLAYIPSGLSGTLAVIALSGPMNNTVIDTVATAVGARTGTVDPKTGRIYLPSAQYAPPARAGQRPAMKPGSFAVLVVDR